MTVNQKWIFFLILRGFCMTQVAQILVEASFRGVPFLWKTVSTDAGRKIAEYEYPLSNRRGFEDLGILNDTFKVAAIIGSENYVENRDRFIKALKTEGLGKLFHPTLGAFDVYALPYTLTESQSELNKATFSVTFKVGQPRITPKVTENFAPAINVQSTNILDAMEVSLSKLLVQSQFPANLNAAAEKVLNIHDLFADATRTITGNPDLISSFARQLQSFNTNRFNLVRNPTALGAAMNGLFVSSNDLAQTPIDRFNLSKKFFNFSPDQKFIPPITTEAIERNANNQLLNDAVNVAGLGQAYRNVPQLDIFDEQDVSETETALNDQYDLIKESKTLNNDALNAVNENRNLIRRFLEQAEDSVFKIISINTKRTTVAVLAYQYYGSTELTDRIIALNQIKDPAFIEGDILIFTK